MTGERSGRFSIVPASAIDDHRLGNAALSVLCALGTYSDRQGWSWPSLRTLAKRLGISRQAVAKQIGELERLEYIEVEHRLRDNGSHSSNAYRIRFDAELSAVYDRLGVSTSGEHPCQPEVNRVSTSEVAPITTHRTSKKLQTISAPQFETFWRVFYGLDDIQGCETAIIVEGEVDKLSLEEAGFRNVLSVPDGAPQKVKAGEVDPEDDAKFEYVWNCKAELACVTKITLACDADGPGRALEEELARRLGRERCWRVAWPDGNDVQLKDANEVLVGCGAEVLRECIEAAQPTRSAACTMPVSLRATCSCCTGTGRSERCQRDGRRSTAT